MAQDTFEQDPNPNDDQVMKEFWEYVDQITPIKDTPKAKEPLVVDSQKAEQEKKLHTTKHWGKEEERLENNNSSQSKRIKSIVRTPVLTPQRLLYVLTFFSLIRGAGRINSDLPTINPAGNRHSCDGLFWEGSHWETSRFLIFNPSIFDSNKAEQATACVRHQ